MSNESRIGFLRAGGDPAAIGAALGRHARAAVRERLVPSAPWQACAVRADSPQLAAMRDWVAVQHPRILRELEGLADGLDLPFAQVFAWNCRGEIAAAPDGCTTVMLPGPRPRIAHNEDGLPQLDGHCFLAEIAPDDEPGFTAFCYPGSLPGHAFAVTGAGMVQTVNNLRLRVRDARAPRMVLGRAVLAASDPKAALGVLRTAPAGAGFHFALAQAGRAEILSVEFGAGRVSQRVVTGPELHANHALHHPGGCADQVVTDSSRDRQAHGTALLESGVRDPLTVLHDEGGPGLPILRADPDDPDDENTLATAVFDIGADDVNWRVHERREAKACHVHRLARS